MNRALFFLICLLTSCNSPYRGYDVLGPDEFVKDSYRIHEGKLAVLELSGHPLPPLDSSLLITTPEVIQEGDLLGVLLLHSGRAELTQASAGLNGWASLEVEDGKILLPDLGAVSVVGKTVEQTKAFLQSEYLRQTEATEVFLTIRERMQYRAELLGLTSVPSLPIYSHTRLYDVLAQAKVPTHANLFASYVIRGGAPLPVDLHRLIVEGDMSQNIVLRGGDKIYIADPNQTRVMVMGEVGRPGPVTMTQPYVSLREVLADAGGIPFTGDRRYIQVIRGNVLQPRIYTLNWTHVIHLPNNSLLLMPGDVVYVAATPITEWGRFINQLLPGFFIFDVAARGRVAFGV